MSTSWPKSFALIGAAGYVAPRHMRAIKAVQGDLKVAVDPNDSVGILDTYFPDADFFTQFERLEAHVDVLRRRNAAIDYVSICSPNHLHDAHCRFALRSGAHAICEKPLVLDPWNIDGLCELEVKTGKRVYTISQLRLHPAIEALKSRIEASPGKNFHVDLTYVVPRGRWYHVSWKGDVAKSGGMSTNIGIHFFDMLVHAFGAATMNVAHLRQPQRAAGFLVCGRAAIRWFLSIDRGDLPASPEAAAKTYRSITVNGEELEFSDGFADLHVRSYEHIVGGGGFDLDAVRPGVEIVSRFRTAPTEPCRGERHPLASRYLAC